MDRIQFLGFLQVEEKASEAVMTVVAKQLAAWFSPPSAKVEENEEGQEYLSTSEPWLTDSCLHPYHMGSHGIPWDPSQKTCWGIQSSLFGTDVVKFEWFKFCIKTHP